MAKISMDLEGQANVSGGSRLQPKETNETSEVHLIIEFS